MISRESRAFKYIDNGFRNLLVLIPGWATDCRIFDNLKLEYDYLAPITFRPETFEEGLLKALRENNVSKVSLFGWSMGGFLASSFASCHKELVDRLILVSVRKRYKKEWLDEIIRRLRKNKKAFLYKFYTRCFFKRENMEWFRRNLLKTYCERMDLGYLLRTLDYLQSAEIRPELLRPIKDIKIIHGEHDIVAPIEEAREIKDSLPQAEFITIKDAGHMPFLEETLSICGHREPDGHIGLYLVRGWTSQSRQRMNEKEIIKRNFSRYARHYDSYSGIQDTSAKMLIEELGSGNFTSILDIGCGTGNYTRLLRERFPLARIKAIDISGEMIQVAKTKLQNSGIEFAVKDAEEPDSEGDEDSKEPLDLITSNASFQWFADLEKALLNYKDKLKTGGVILFSAFGPGTFYELNDALKELLKGGKEISSRSFLGRIRIEGIMEGLFKKIEVREESFKENHASLRELLKKIKYSGIRGNGIGAGTFWVSERIDSLERVYRKRFKEIAATYQVFFCKGVK